jgi:hypothetical protein
MSLSQSKYLSGRFVNREGILQSHVPMLGVCDAEAHAKVFADFSSAVVYKTVATGARLKLLNENSAKLWVHLGLHPHAV